MADEVATAVSDSAVQDTGVQESATEETKLEVVTEGKELNPNDFSQDDPVTEDADQSEAEETKEEPQDTKKPVSPKAENRFQKLANENRELKERLANLKLREAQLATEQDLLNEINPETNELYTPQEVERLAFQRSREQQLQQVSQERYEAEVQENIQKINDESLQVVQEFPLFNKESSEFREDLAVAAAEVLNEALAYDDNEQLIGSNVSPYKLYKLAATAYQAGVEASAVPNQIKGQKAAEQMLAAADNPSSAKPTKASAKDEASMTPAEYAKAHGLQPQW